MSFEGKVAIVTASGVGIGREVAYLLGIGGASVTIHGQNAERLAQTAAFLAAEGIPANRIHSVIGPIQDEKTRLNLINETVQKFGKLDILINNAGVSHKDGLDPNSIENLDYVYNCNLRSLIVLSKLAFPHLEKTKGNIVNVSSMGSQRSLPAQPYVISKAALDHYTRIAAVEYGKKGVRVNTVSPGVTTTTSSSATKMHKIELQHQQVPLDRVGTAREVANVIEFVASDKASYMNGSNVVVDGGVLAAAGNKEAHLNLKEKRLPKVDMEAKMEAVETQQGGTISSMLYARGRRKSTSTKQVTIKDADTTIQHTRPITYYCNAKMNLTTDQSPPPSTASVKNVVTDSQQFYESKRLMEADEQNTTFNFPMVPNSKMAAELTKVIAPGAPSSNGSNAFRAPLPPTQRITAPKPLVKPAIPFRPVAPLTYHPSTQSNNPINFRRPEVPFRPQVAVAPSAAAVLKPASAVGTEIQRRSSMPPKSKAISRVLNPHDSFSEPLNVSSSALEPKRMRISAPAIVPTTSAVTTRPIAQTTNAVPRSNGDAPDTASQRFRSLGIVTLRDAQKKASVCLGSQFLTIAATVQSVVKNLSIQSNCWTMRVCLVDESSAPTECDINPELLQRLINLSAPDAMRIRLSGNTREINEGRKRLKSLNDQLKRLDLIFDVEFWSNMRPIIHNAQTMAERLNIG